MTKQNSVIEVNVWTTLVIISEKVSLFSSMSHLQKRYPNYCESKVAHGVGPFQIISVVVYAFGTLVNLNFSADPA